MILCSLPVMVMLLFISAVHTETHWRTVWIVPFPWIVYHDDNLRKGNSSDSLNSPCYLALSDRRENAGNEECQTVAPELRWSHCGARIISDFKKFLEPIPRYWNQDMFWISQKTVHVSSLQLDYDPFLSLQNAVIGINCWVHWPALICFWLFLAEYSPLIILIPNPFTFRAVAARAKNTEKFPLIVL